MAVDTPATIAILGAGPVGIEAGLYARYLGYSVVIYEQREVASHVRACGHLRLFSPFHQLRSTLGLAALRAQDPDYRPPDETAQLLAQQWVDQYLRPLSRTDLLADEVRCHTRVLAVERPVLPAEEAAADAEPDDNRFRIVVEHAGGPQTQEWADVVIDCTGVYGHPNGCGAGGSLARGECAVRAGIVYGVPDVLGAARVRYAERRVLVVGSGLSAAASIIALVKLAHRAPETRVTWIVSETLEGTTDGPIPVARYARCPEQQRLALAANRHARAGTTQLDVRPGTTVAAIEWDSQAEQYVVQFADAPSPERYDQIIANTGYRADHAVCATLRVAQRPVAGASPGLGEHPAEGTETGQRELRPERLLTPEPNYYILGSKSVGGDGRFLITDGLQQIRDLFGIIGGRRELDLYATVAKLAQ